MVEIEHRSELRCSSMPRTEEQREAHRRNAERIRAAKRKGRPTVLVRVSLESFYLPGQVVELIGGPGDSDGGCVVEGSNLRGAHPKPQDARGVLPSEDLPASPLACCILLYFSSVLEGKCQ